MSLAASSPYTPFSHFEQLREGRAIVETEAAALAELARRLDAAFCDAVQRIHDCSGSVIVTGMGKAGLIGRKIAATLSSTGTRSHFLHPAEAVHGDLGCLHADDVLLALSNSGETEELCRLLPIVRRLGIAIIAMTASDTSQLGREADVTLRLGRLREAGPLGLAPSTSTTAMLALGDAIALVVSRLRGFTPQQFAVFHPGGSLGERLKTIRDVMRTGDELRVASESETIRQVFVSLSRPGRRTGAVILVDAEGRLTGIFTDSDLARLLEQRKDFHLDRPIVEVMTPRPLTVQVDAPLQVAIELLSRHKVSELPVVDARHAPAGLIDITDVLGLMPREELSVAS
jgi:arabinose-5-phosphate isomerase